MAEIKQVDREAAEILFSNILGDTAAYGEFGYPSYREEAVRTIAEALVEHRETPTIRLENEMARITDPDREMAAKYFTALCPDMPNLAQRVMENQTALSRAFAAHREAAEKAERERIAAWLRKQSSTGLFFADAIERGAAMDELIARDADLI